MMANCSDNVYVIKYTDKSKGTITIAKSSLVTNLVDIALVGKSRLDYGEAFNESMLHLLENFACPSVPDQTGVPDTLYAFGTLLVNPVTGQKWFNTTSQRLYVYDGVSIVPRWIPLAKQGDVAGNSGIIADGAFLPQPVNMEGYVFPYYECSFTVSQHSNRSIAADTFLPTNTEIDYVKCFVDQNGQVTMKFRYRGESSLRSGYANYQIIGIRDEVNHGPVLAVTPYPVPAATPDVSVTPSPTITPPPSPSNSVGAPPATPQPSLSKTPTPTPTQTSASGSTPTPTPTNSPTRTPVPTASPSSSAAIPVTPTTTPTPTPTVSLTRTVTPTPTPSPSAVYSVNLAGVPTNLTNHIASVPAFVSLRFNPDGTWVAQIRNMVDSSGIWAPSGIGNNYELFYTLTATGTSDVQSSPPSVWNSLGTAVQFSLNDHDPSNDGVGIQENISYTIRNKISHTDSVSSTLLMDVDGGCFAVGSSLMTGSGNVNVENLIIGNKVSSFSHSTMIDESNENWKDWKTTDNNFTIGESTVVSARRFFANGGIDIDGIITTKSHVHFVFDGTAYGWKNASNVLVTDKLVNMDGTLVDIINITELSGQLEFVALDVETDDTLIVSNNGMSILSHNASA